MADATLWWVLTGALIIAELLTGTFYLLMIALGLACGALAAHAGLGQTVQIVAAAVVGIAAVMAWHLRRQRLSRAQPRAGANPDVNLDVGESVHVDAWSPEGTAQVRYRGADWTAMPARPGKHLQPGTYRIVELRGSHLMVEFLH